VTAPTGGYPALSRIYYGLQNLQKSCYSLISPFRPVPVWDLRVGSATLVTMSTLFAHAPTTRHYAARDLPFPPHPLDNGAQRALVPRNRTTKLGTNACRPRTHSVFKSLRDPAANPSVHATDQRLDRASVHGPSVGTMTAAPQGPTCQPPSTPSTSSSMLRLSIPSAHSHHHDDIFFSLLLLSFSLPTTPTAPLISVSTDSPCVQKGAGNPYLPAKREKWSALEPTLPRFLPVLPPRD
jgi:hypothetical protein